VSRGRIFQVKTSTRLYSKVEIKEIMEGKPVGCQIVVLKGTKGTKGTHPQTAGSAVLVAIGHR
jgi:hypothetical protein